MDAPACTIELEWTRDGEPQQLSHQVNIIGAKKPANFFHIRYSPPAVGELCSFVHMYMYIMIMLVTYACMCVCSHTNTVSTSTVPDTPSGATPTVQDVTASHTEHSKQGISA